MSNIRDRTHRRNRRSLMGSIGGICGRNISGKSPSVKGLRACPQRHRFADQRATETM
jgi:hypothetical protein